MGYDPMYFQQTEELLHQPIALDWNLEDETLTNIGSEIKKGDDKDFNMVQMGRILSNKTGMWFY